MEKRPRSPTIASQVNDFDFLMKRVRRCRQTGDAPPNIVAVDYYNKGDVVDAVQEPTPSRRQETQLRTD